MHTNESPELDALRSAVASASRQLADAGVAPGTAGNISARAGDLVAVTPTGAELAVVLPADITVVDLAGRVVAGALAPTSELDLHLGVYARYGAGAVVHAHPPAATALACVLDELPAVHYAMLALGGSVRVAPYRTFGTPELAEVVLDALEGKTAALMANHGMVAHGVDLSAAVRTAELLEWAARLYLDAASIGTPRVLDDDDLAAVAEAITSRSYGSTQSA